MISTILKIFKRSKKKPKKLFYEDFILEYARDNNIELTEVHDLELVKTLPFEEGLYETISALIKEGNINAVKNMVIDEGLLGELSLVTFTSQTGGQCVALLYDSYDTWEQPIVAEVIRLRG